MVTLNPELVKNIKESPIFPELKEYLLECVEELNCVDDLDRFPNEKAGEEAKIRLKALRKLQEILKPFIDFREKWEPTEEEIKAKKEQFGL